MKRIIFFTLCAIMVTFSGCAPAEANAPKDISVSVSLPGGETADVNIKF
jgi:hypothetical protein